jgi:tetratricopeptide (TPR) repeat protein
MPQTDDLIDLAWQARREGRHADAERGLIQAIEGSRAAGSRVQLIRALKALAHVFRDTDQEQRALAANVEAVALSRAEGDVLLLAHTIRHLGDLHREADRLDEADRCYAEALTLYRRVASPPALDFANALRAAALLKERQDSPQAQQLWSEARVYYEAARIQAGIDDCTTHLGARG